MAPASNDPAERLSERFTFLEGGIGWRYQLAVFAIAFLAFVSRRPDALFHAQFFAEDGVYFFSDAYNDGWLRSLSLPLGGYYHTLPRIAGALAQFVPLRDAPLLMNLIGLTFQVLPINVLLSGRCSSWGPFGFRALLAFAYVALPSSYEVDASITEVQWHLAFLAFLVALASPPRNWWERVFDVAILVLFGFTGVFCLPLLPIVFVFWWLRRDRWRLVAIAALTVPFFVQLVTFTLTSAANRSPMRLGANVKVFLEMLAGDVYLAALVGMNHLATEAGTFIVTVVALLGTAILVYFFLNANLELRLFGVFAFSVLAGSLKTPQVSLVQPQWEVLRDAPGIRYWFFPVLAFAWALIWAATLGRWKPIRFLSGVALLVMCFGIVRDWRYPAYPDSNFHTHTREFAAAPMGTLVTIPIDPPGWSIHLVKKDPRCGAVPIGFIDLPANDARVSGQVQFVGWVGASGQQVERVSISTDGAVIGSVVPAVQRQDADFIHPELTNKNKGWELGIDTTKLSPGKHQITAHALEANGCDLTFASITIERAP